MDAYVPIADSLTPAITTPANDQPWRTIGGTRTLLWFNSAAARGTAGYSAAPQATFFLFDAPELAGLERIRSFATWGDNWDAEGARAPNPAVLNDACLMFSLLAVHKVPQVTLTAEGHPMFAFDGAVQGEVVMTEPGKFDYFFAADGAPSDEGVAFDGNALPKELLDYINPAAA